MGTGGGGHGLRTTGLIGALLAAAIQSVSATAQPARPAAETRLSGPSEPGRDDGLASAVEAAQPSRGRVTVGGRAVDYTVTPGTLTIRNDEGEPVASMFYVAYVADAPKGAPPRPVTFAYNGGPGSSSMWLHMGSIGPLRVHTPTSEPLPAAPYEIVENRYTLLDRTDIVFLDAIGTGLSRPLGKANGADFWGVDQDIGAFAQGIVRYLTINDRWNSPKFLFGESYGTMRTGGLAYVLQNQGVQLNGLVLKGSTLNYGIRQDGYDHPFVNFLPSLAATAWFHRKLENRPATLEPFLTEVREWARGPYLSALAKGSDARPQERQAIAEAMSRYTGLSVRYILDSDLRVEPGRFRKELLRDRGRTVSRLDSRYLGTDSDAAGATPEYDATSPVIGGPYISGLNAYLFGNLGYRTNLYYRPNYYSQIGGGRWDTRHKGPGEGPPMLLTQTAGDLAAAMRQNPYLKVLSLNGYYDLATPFFNAEYDLNHLRIGPDIRRNITVKHFEAGHMIYANPEVLPAFKQALDTFYGAAAARTRLAATDESAARAGPTDR